MCLFPFINMGISYSRCFSVSPAAMLLIRSNTMGRIISAAIGKGGVMPLLLLCA